MAVSVTLIYALNGQKRWTKICLGLGIEKYIEMTSSLTSQRLLHDMHHITGSRPCFLFIFWRKETLHTGNEELA